MPLHYWFAEPLLALCLWAGAPAQREDLSVGELETIQTPELIVIGFRDFDLLLRQYPALNTEIEFKDRQGKSLGRHEWDYTLPAARSHLVFEKRPGSRYHSVSLVLRDGKKLLGRKKLLLPPSVTATATVPWSTEPAFVIPGTQPDPQALPQKILLPNYHQSRAVALSDSPRRWNLENSLKRVVADFNFPSMGSLNYLGETTDH